MLEPKNEAMGLRHFAEAIRRNWWLALLVAVPLFAAVALYTLTLPSQYTAEAVVAFSPSADQQSGADLIRITLPKYLVYSTADKTLESLSARTGIPQDDIDKHVTAKVATDTANLSLTVEGTDPALVTQIANALALDVVSFAKDDPVVVAKTISPAVEPREPVGPPRKLLLAGGLLVAVLAGAGVAVAMDRLLPRISSVDDVRAIAQAPVLGRIPVSRDARRKPAAALGTDGHLASAVRALRTSLLVHLPPEPGICVLVTSSVPGEGKSCVASWLAASLAQVRNSVLLIDGDMVHPSIARIMGVNTQFHIGQVLSGAVSVTAAVQQSSTPGLDILPAVEDKAAGDRLTVGMYPLLEEARKTYSVIIVDAPPVVGSDVGQTLASQADRCLFVTSLGSPAKSASTALELLDLVEAHVAGVVVNRVPSRVSDAYTSYHST